MSFVKNGVKKIIIINGYGDNVLIFNYVVQMINCDVKIFVCVDSGEISDVDIY